MIQTPPEVVISAISFIAFWLITVLGILIAGQFHPAIGEFRRWMTVYWEPALGMAGLFVLGMALGGRGFLNPYALAIFCQALLGLAIASSIEGFQPLPVTIAFVQGSQILRQTGLLLLVS